MHRVLDLQANSLAVKGPGGENMKSEAGTAICRIALWILMGLPAVCLIQSILRMIRYGRITGTEFAGSCERTKKVRMIKNFSGW